MHYTNGNHHNAHTTMGALNHMGTKRDFDSGRRDTMGRRIKESGKRRNSRAREKKTTKEALEDFNRLANEFNTEAENAAMFVAQRDAKNLEEAATRAAYLYGLYRKWSDEVGDFSHEDAIDNYKRFRSTYGLDKKGRIPIKIEALYDNVNFDSALETHEAIYDILSTSYMDKVTEEEMNNYKEKIEAYRNGYAPSAEDVHNERTQRQQDEHRQQREQEEDEYENDAPRTQSKRNHKDEHSRARGNRSTHDNAPYSRDEHHESRGRNNRKSDSPDADEQNRYRGGKSQRDAYVYSKNAYSRYSHGSQNNIPRGSGRSRSGVFNKFEDMTGLSSFGGFRVTWRPRVGPFVMNMGRKGASSVSLDAGPLRYMVWQRGRGFGAWFSSVDLPSFLSFRGRGR